jgi:hypothetical protein
MRIGSIDKWCGRTLSTRAPRGWKPLLGLALLAGAANLSVAEAGGQTWPEGKTYELKGLRVNLSAPVLMARRKSFYWFPKIMRLTNGELLGQVQVDDDRHWEQERQEVLWSSDGGMTWGDAKEFPVGTSARVPLYSGDVVLLPYRLRTISDGMKGDYGLIVKDKHEVQYVKDGVIVTGWPRRPVSADYQVKIGQASFCFDGQTVTLKDGKYLVTLNGWFEQALSKNGFPAFDLAPLAKERVKTSIVAAESEDGLHWKIRSIIADEHWPLAGIEGPNEGTLGRLKDGRLMSVFRSYYSSYPYGASWSGDEGKTWTEPAWTYFAWSVDPRMAVMQDGTVILSGGRPGVLMWFNVDGSGKDWQVIDLLDHHNAFRPREPLQRYDPVGSSGHFFGTSTGYTEVVAVDDTHLLCVYDRTPLSSTWDEPTPAVHKRLQDEAETYSVWVVRATLTRTEQR